MKAAIRDNWWLLAGAVVISACVAFILMSGRTGEYVSTGTYIVRPTSTSDEDVIRATLGLTDAVKVESTYAFVIESDRIVDAATERVVTDGDEVESVEVQAATVPGADMLTISASSRDAELAYRMATAVGEEAAAYVASFDTLFSLVPLDEPTVPTTPERFDSGVLLLVVSGSVGIVSGGLAALLLDHWWGRYWRLHGRNDAWGDLDTDDVEYTRLRLLEEMSRADSSGASFHLAIIEDGRGSGLSDLYQPRSRSFERKTVEVVGPTLRRYQHAGRCEGVDRGRVAAILPDVSSDDLERLASRWKASLEASTGLGRARISRVMILDCRYEGGAFTGAPAAVQAAEQLVR